jgi:hypothetical protein
MRKVLIIDTCLLCVWLKVPAMELCGSNEDKWNHDRVDKKIKEEIDKSTTLVLPLATIVETGNHIAQARAKQREIAEDFAKIMTNTANEMSPWAAFSEQVVLWEAEALKKLAAKFSQSAMQKISMGDASIAILGEHYRQKGFHVEFLTADRELKAQEPSPPPSPTRRSSRKLGN